MGLRRLLAVLLVTASVFAGCFGVDDPSGDALVEEPPVPQAFIPRTLHLTSDGGLSAEIPPAGSFPAGDFIVKWTTGTGTHPLFAGPGGLLISPQDVTVTLWLEADLVVVPAEGVLPDVAAWFGADGHTPIVAGARFGPLLPGEPLEVTFGLAHSELQPVLEARERLDLLVSVTMTQLDAHGVRILTGPTHPSRVGFVAAASPAMPDLPPDLVADTVSGSVPLPDRIIGSLPVPGLNFVDLDVAVDENVSHLRIHVAATGGGPTVDMDMVLLDAEGRVITWGVTPYAVEMLLLQGDGLAPYRGETLTLRVANHLGVAMAFDATIEQG